MDQPQVLVNANFIKHVRLLLIRLAQTDDSPSDQRKPLIERHRQYIEGYLGLNREKLATENTSTVEDVLSMCGFEAPETMKLSNTRLDVNPITVEHLHVYFDKEQDERDGQGICVDDSGGSSGMRFRTAEQAADYVKHQILRLTS